MDERAHGGCFPILRQAGLWRGCLRPYFHARYVSYFSVLFITLCGANIDAIADPILKDHFWMNPFAKHFSTIKASDLVLLDADGYVVDGGAQLPVNEAGFLIHSEIHKARPDVVAAAHTHGIHGKTWSAFGKPIEMLTQGESSLGV